MTALSMKKFFMEKAPLGATKSETKRLTQVSMIAARLWELSQRKDTERLETMIYLFCLYLDQTSVDLAAGGETELGWNLLCLPDPDYAETSSHRVACTAEPFAALADPTWINGLMLYLRDLDFYRRRQDEARKATMPSKGYAEKGNVDQDADTGRLTKRQEAAKKRAEAKANARS